MILPCQRFLWMIETSKLLGLTYLVSIWKEIHLKMPQSIPGLLKNRAGVKTLEKPKF